MLDLKLRISPDPKIILAESPLDESMTIILGDDNFIVTARIPDTYQLRLARLTSSQAHARPSIVSIHALVMSATPTVGWASGVTSVSIHALVMSATIRKRSLRSPPAVSIHALVMSATCCTSQCCPVRNVSIHALVMSATDMNVKTACLCIVSIHALVMSTT